MGVWETLMLDVVALEAHQNDRSYIRELSGPSIQHGGRLHEGPQIKVQIKKYEARLTKI